MNAPSPTQTVVVDLDEVADEVFTYRMEALRRAVVSADVPACPSALEYEPQLPDGVD